MMPWGLFGVALIVALVLQTSVLPFSGLREVDLLLVLALVCGLAAPTIDARLAGCLVGFAQDIDTAGPLGWHALLLGLTATLLTVLRDWVNLHLWWARWLIAFTAALPGQIVVEVHLRFGRGEYLRGVWGAVATATVAALLAALLTGLPAWLRRRQQRRRTAF